MSTKTTFKRIALGLVAVLGFGLLSATPSNAAILTDSLTVTTTNGVATDTGGASDTSNATVATVTVSFTSTAADTVVVSFIPVTAPSTQYIRIWGGVRTETEAVTAASGIDTSSSTGAATAKVFGDPDRQGAVAVARNDTALITVAANTTAVATMQVYIESKTGSRTAGTYSWKAVASGYNGATVGGGTLVKEVSATFSIVVAAQAKNSLVASAAYSQAYLSASGGANADAVPAVSSTASTAPRAILEVKLRNAANGVAARESVTVTTDVGLVGLPTGTFGKSITMVYNSDDSITVYVRADGTSGKATITVSTPSVVFPNKTMYFYGAVASLTATPYANTVGVGSNSAAIAVSAKDASGTVNGSNTAILIYSSNTAVISDTAAACTFSTTYSVHFCTLTGVAAGTADITIGTAGKAIVSSAMTVRVTGPNAATVKLSFDKAKYAPGEKGYVLVQAFDSAGKEVAGSFTNLLATGGISTTAGLTSVGGGVSTLDSLTTSSVSPTLAFSSSGYVSKEPVYAIPFYAPQTSGAIKISATGGTALPASGQVAITATATVENAAETAANSALAAVTALASQVSAFITKINAQITTLTDLVMKIQKKVKA